MNIKEKVCVRCKKCKKLEYKVPHLAKIYIYCSCECSNTDPERIKKISNYMKGRKSWNKGLNKNTDKRIQQPWLGKKRSIEFIKKSSKSHKKRYKDHPEIIIKQKQTRKQTLIDNPEILKKMSASMQGIDIKNWEKFISREPYDQNWTEKFRKQVRDRDGDKCMKCEISRSELSKALDVHHIDYNKTYSILKNCISLCNKCHMNTMINRKYCTNYFRNILTKNYGYYYDNN